MFIFIIVGLLVFSFLLALFSLWRDIKKNIKTEQVSEELSKGRVVFHASGIPDMPVHHEQPAELSAQHIESAHTEPNLPSQSIADIPSPHKETSSMMHSSVSEHETLPSDSFTSEEDNNVHEKTETDM